jgi:hypothetical protein
MQQSIRLLFIGLLLATSFAVVVTGGTFLNLVSTTGNTPKISYAGAVFVNGAIVLLQGELNGYKGCCLANSLIYVSVDGGRSFSSQIPQGLPASKYTPLAVFPKQGGTILVRCGGFDSGFLPTDCYRSTSDMLSWSKQPQALSGLPGHLVSHSMIAARSPPCILQSNACQSGAYRLYIIGGFDTSATRNDVWYSDDAMAWSRIVSPENNWLHRSGMGCTTVFDDSRVVIAGGVTIPRGATTVIRNNDVWISNVGLTEWFPRGVAPWRARFGLTLTNVRDRLIVVGGMALQSGSTSSDEACNDVWISIDVGFNWYLLSQGDYQARASHAALAIGSSLMIIGGDRADVDTNANDVLEGFM